MQTPKYSRKCWFESSSARSPGAAARSRSPRSPPARSPMAPCGTAPCGTAPVSAPRAAATTSKCCRAAARACPASNPRTPGTTPAAVRKSRAAFVQENDLISGFLFLRSLLNLHIGWELATREERRMLVRTMVQEVGCDVGTKRIVWVKVKPDYEILFRLMDRLDPGVERRYWIREQETEGWVPYPRWA
jgi:hypothetical protein